MLDRLRSVFSCLSRNRVRYVVIGGIAAVMHGVPRSTFDLDILIDPTIGNARRLLAALREARFGTADLITPEQLLSKEIIMFRDWVRIDVQTSTPGLAFAEAWKRRKTMRYRGQPFHVASRADLIASKRAAGRPIDLEDVRMLEAGEDR